MSCHPACWIASFRAAWCTGGHRIPATVHCQTSHQICVYVGRGVILHAGLQAFAQPGARQKVDVGVMLGLHAGPMPFTTPASKDAAGLQLAPMIHGFLKISSV